MNYPWELMGLAALLLVNRLAVRLKRDWLFWLVQVGNVAVAVWIGWKGISGMESFPIANWMIVALLVFHLVQNHSIRERTHLEAREQERFRENLKMMRKLEEKP